MNQLILVVTTKIKDNLFLGMSRKSELNMEPFKLKDIVVSLVIERSTCETVYRH